MGMDISDAEAKDRGAAEGGRAARVAACALHRKLRADCRPRSGVGGLKGWWEPDSVLDPGKLLEAFQAVEAQTGAAQMKSGRSGEVARGQVLGRPVVLKRYALRSLVARLKYAFRVSRGRRAFLAARVLQELGVATPLPHGFLERRSAGLPVCSYYAAQDLDAAPTLRQWIEQHYGQASAAWRERTWGAIYAFMLGLYQRGVYHGDTKALNILVLNPEADEAPRLAWIDLECMQFGVRLSRRRILRNLIQMNGSLAHAVPPEDLEAFLRRFAGPFPWVGADSVLRRISAKTRWRLFKERAGWDGA